MEETKKLSFEERYKSYKEQGGEAPTIRLDATVKFQFSEATKQVVLSVQEIDSDGEIVDLTGMTIRNGLDSVPMIDSHNSWDSVTRNGLGAIRNLKFVKMGDKNALVGEPDFAPTEAGNTARILYMGVDGGKPYFTDVSIGFMVFDYDNQTRTIKESEVFECSLVTAGANRGARFVDKSLEEKSSPHFEEDVQIAKDLARFKAINEPFKEITKTLLSDEFCGQLGYEKDGDLLIDINNIYDMIKKLVAPKQEAPAIAKVAPKELDKSAVQIAVTKALVARLGI